MPKLKPGPELLAKKDQLLAAPKETRFSVLDARSEGEHCGDTKLAKRSGAIPGAKHLEWVDVLDRTRQRFKGPAELKKLIKDAGVDLSRPQVTYCQSGG